MVATAQGEQVWTLEQLIQELHIMRPLPKDASLLPIGIRWLKTKSSPLAVPVSTDLCHFDDFLKGPDAQEVVIVAGE